MHPNEEWIRRVYAAFAAADMDAVGASFDEDIVWHSLGQSRFSRDYRSPGHERLCAPAQRRHRAGARARPPLPLVGRPQSSQRPR
jgi:ketosteroid isomerase-like protein